MSSKQWYLFTIQHGIRSQKNSVFTYLLISNRYSFVLPAFVVVTLKMVAVGFLHSYVSLHYHTSLQSRRNCIVDLKLSENQVNMKHQ